MKRLLVLLLVLATAVPAAAEPSLDQLNKELERTRQKVAEAERRERGLKKDIALTDAERRKLQAEWAALGDEMSSAEARYDSAQGELNAVQEQLMAKTKELDATLASLQVAQDRVRRRAAQVYRSGPASFLGFLLGSFSFHDLVNRMGLLGHVFRDDDQQVDTLRATRVRVAAERDQISKLRDEVASRTAVVAYERNQVAGVRSRLDAKSDRLSADLKTKHATLEDVQEDKETYLRKQRELEQTSASIGAFLRGRTGGKANVGKGGMRWPVSGPVTSPFGWRTHPIFGTRRFHAGIDIAVPMGSPVRAAAAGQVIYAGAKGGYGNVVIVDHGGGLATLYAHLSGFSAGNGTVVGIGQTVARAGCSGHCTGPHLHFEVRIKGEPQNPMAWL